MASVMGITISASAMASSTVAWPLRFAFISAPCDRHAHGNAKVYGADCREWERDAERKPVGSKVENDEVGRAAGGGHVAASGVFGADAFGDAGAVVDAALGKDLDHVGREAGHDGIALALQVSEADEIANVGEREVGRVAVVHIHRTGGEAGSAAERLVE